MTLPALRDDALLVTATDGFRAAPRRLPWIRSLPLASLLEPVGARSTAIGTSPSSSVDGGAVTPAELAAEEHAGGSSRIASCCEIPDAVTPGTHEVAVSFRLVCRTCTGAGRDAPSAPAVLVRTGRSRLGCREQRERLRETWGVAA